MTTHKYAALISLFFFVSGLFSQDIFIKGLVLSEDSTPVQYATIYDGSLKSGTFSDSTGRFSINMPGNVKELYISAIGYKNKTIAISQKDNLSDFRIVLLNDTFNLKEVVISSKIFKSKPITLGPRKKRKGRGVICGYSFSHEEGLYIPNLEQIHGVLKHVEVYLKKEKGIAETKHLIRLRIYSVNEELYPEKELLLDNIFLQLKKSSGNQLVKIDLEKHNILIPSNGIFIVLEAVQNPHEPHLQHSSTQETGVDNCSSISIVLVDDDTRSFVQWNRINKAKWHHIDFTSRFNQHGRKLTNLVPYVKLTINEYASGK